MLAMTRAGFWIPRITASSAWHCRWRSTGRLASPAAFHQPPGSDPTALRSRSSGLAGGFDHSQSAVDARTGFVSTSDAPQQDKQASDSQRTLFKDRLSPGGNWVGSSEPKLSSAGSIRPSGTTLSHPHVIGRSKSRQGASQKLHPPAEPISNAELDQLVEFIQDSSNLLVITGAGCSTESDIPDYRSPSGAYSSGYKPMTHQQFMANDANRSRYWQRSSAGYKEFANARCNDAHVALQQMEEMGWVKNVITQNVDRLHHKAGSRNVLELHGTTHMVVCTSCESVMDRKTLQDTFEDLNGDLMKGMADLTGADANADPALEANQIRRPDGDTDAELSREFRVPPCDACGGVLKPDVVFFGANVPKGRADRALALAEQADRILVVGSSLMVYSVFRLIKANKERGGKLAILTVGPTRADDLADLKLEYLAGQTLARATRHPTLSIPSGR